MIYVASDIHGCYDKYKALLERLNLKKMTSFIFWAIWSIEARAE